MFLRKYLNARRFSTGSNSIKYSRSGYVLSPYAFISASGSDYACVSYCGRKGVGFSSSGEWELNLC